MSGENDMKSLFLDSISKLVPELPDNNESLGLAVSGGPDSLALLLIAHKVFPQRIAAATVDHGLRPEARSEAEFVAKICEGLGIPHEILRPAIPIRGSIQMVARRTRYTLLESWMERKGLTYLATAHHADDQLETLVMRILRGSGIEGMSAIRARRGHIIRPLLKATKTQLVDYVKAQDIEPVHDPSNDDNSFDRVRVRKALSQLEGFDISAASISASALDEARTAIAWMVDELAANHIAVSADGASLNRTDFPNEITRRMVLKCLHHIDPALSPRGTQLDHAISMMTAGRTVTLGDILCIGGTSWTFGAAPLRAKRD